MKDRLRSTLYAPPIFWLWITGACLGLSWLRAEPVRIDDFESGTLNGWTVTGDAFGQLPVGDAELRASKRVGIYQNHVRGTFQGEKLLSSLQTAFETHAASSVTSAPFEVTRRYLNLLMGGNSQAFLATEPSGGIGLRILLDGKTVLHHPHLHGVEGLRWYTLDLEDFRGKSVQLEVYDEERTAFILVDEILLEDTRRAAAPEKLERRLVVDGPVISIPSMAKTDPKPAQRMLRVLMDGKDVIRPIVTHMADGDPDFYAPLYVDQWMGKEITLQVDQLDHGSDTLQNLACQEQVKERYPLYEEDLRPLVHFTPKTGYTNDPNGLVYYDGEYHLFWQSDPFNMANLNFYWGHAVSKDLIHWEEKRSALRGGLESVGFAWSGGAFVDHNNDGGWQQGDEKTIVATFWDYHIRKSSLAYSTDRGRHFTRFEGSPIVDTKGTDPSRVFYHAPTARWVLVVTDQDEAGRGGMRLYHSTNLREWTEGSITFFENKERFYECPDFYELPVCDREGRPLEPAQTKWIMHDGKHYYAVCEFDGTDITIVEEPGRLVEPGNFYAAQKWSDIPAEDGRTIVTAWQRQMRFPSPQTHREPKPEHPLPFDGQLTFPVEMTLRQTEAGLRLFANPIREIAKLHKTSHAYAEQPVEPGKALFTDHRAKALHAVFEVDPGEAATLEWRLHGEGVRYEVGAGEITYMGKTQKLPLHQGQLKLEVILDVASVVLFFNDGQLYAPINHLARVQDRGISLTVTGGPAILRLAEIHELKSMWEPPLSSASTLNP